MTGLTTPFSLSHFLHLAFPPPFSSNSVISSFPSPLLHPLLPSLSVLEAPWSSVGSVLSSPAAVQIHPISRPSIPSLCWWPPDVRSAQISPLDSRLISNHLPKHLLGSLLKLLTLCPKWNSWPPQTIYVSSVPHLNDGKSFSTENLVAVLASLFLTLYKQFLVNPLGSTLRIDPEFDHFSPLHSATPGQAAIIFDLVSLPPHLTPTPQQPYYCMLWMRSISFFLLPWLVQRVLKYWKNVFWMFLVHLGTRSPLKAPDKCEVVVEEGVFRNFSLEFMLVFIFLFLGTLHERFPWRDVKYGSCILIFFPFLLFYYPTSVVRCLSRSCLLFMCAEFKCK